MYDIFATFCRIDSNFEYVIHDHIRMVDIAYEPNPTYAAIAANVIFLRSNFNFVMHVH